MIWTLCFFISLLLLLLAAAVGLRRRFGDLRVGAVLLALVVSAFVAYLPVFLGQYVLSVGLLESLLNTLRIISLDADYLEFQELISGAVGGGFFCRCYLILLGLLHILLPAVAALAAYTILLRCYVEFRLFIINSHKRPLYVLSGLSERTLALAGSIREAQKKSDVVFTGCGETPKNSRLIQRQKYVFHGDGITDLKVKKRALRDVFYFCIGDDEDANLNDALKLIAANGGLPKNAQERVHIFLRCGLPDCDTMVDATKKGSLDIRIFSDSEEIAYRLLQEHPLTEGAKEGEIELLLVGMGDVNLSVLRTACWCGQLDGYRLKIRVAGKDVGEKKAEFLVRYPALAPGGRYDVLYFDCPDGISLQNAVKEHCSNATYVVIDCGSDSRNVELALQLRLAYYRMDPGFSKEPPVFVYLRSSDKSEMIRDLKTSDSKESRRVPYRLRPFGNLSEIYSYGNLVASPLEALAKNVHLVYSDIFSDGALNVEDALTQYNLLEVKKRSNRANALHIRYKLALLGLDYTEDENAEEVDPGAFLSKEKLAKLTYSEHDRWMAFLESEGWTGATMNDVNAYRDAGLAPGRHESTILKMHPFICDFYDLPAVSEALHQKDSTIYDEQLIARIPDILHDRWGVSKRKYRIISSNKNTGGND
ncbi:MAG: hypothetical protein IJS65_08005 [Clostridia bacterium]|nr:hypothetical protein [Clostridia bacterium]